MPHRVVVTGFGCVSPLGLSVPELWKALLAGSIASKNISSSPNWSHLNETLSKVPCNVFCPIDSIPRRESLNERIKYPRSFEFIEMASLEALKRSKLSQSAGVFIGWGMPGTEEVYDLAENFSNPKRVSPYLLPSILGNSPASFVSRKFNLKGPLSAPSLACATGSYAVGEAFRFLSDERNEGCDAILAGATEVPINAPSIIGFSRVGALATGFNSNPEEASRPFCRKRNGFVMGEGAGVMVLERLDAAVKRNAPIFAEIVGFASFSDAHHPTSPDPDGFGAKMAIRSALNGIDPELLVGVNAHATSTKVGDEIELKALNDLFPSKKLIITSNKGNFGHLLGAGSIVESIITVLGLHHRIVPAIASLTDPLPTHHTFAQKNQKITEKEFYFLKNSFGFGGVNVALAFKNWQGRSQGTLEECNE